MGERLLCKQEVVGSIPITSTTERAKLVSSAAAVAQQPREPPRDLRSRGARVPLPRFDTNDASRRSVSGGPGRI